MRSLVWRFLALNRAPEAHLVFQVLSDEDRRIFMEERLLWVTTGVHPLQRRAVA